MQHLHSLLRRAALVAFLSVAALVAAPATFCDDTAYASGRGRDDDDTPDFDDWEVEDRDHDNSGPGNADDWDRDWGDDDRGSDNSGHGNDNDDRDDDHGSSGRDDDDHSGRGSDHDDRRGSGRDEDHNSDHANDEIIYSVEYDSHGDEYTPGEIVFVGTRRELASAINVGFRRIRLQALHSGGVMARLAIPARLDMEEALTAIRAAAPAALATPNNIYRSAQSSRHVTPQATEHTQLRLRGAMGVIDTGVDAGSITARGAILSQRAFAGAQPVPRDHGTTVAAIAVSRGIRVHVADVFGQSADGALAASAERIAAAVDWMIAHRVAVVNISVEGPNNAVLDEMIQRAARRGHIIVAAAGNGGPSARPTFPAAFDGVQAVTAIDGNGRPYVRANRGDYVDFAAPGVDVSVTVGDTVERVSGTSFAAPVIAAEVAAHLDAPSPEAAQRVLTRLRESAVDLGAPGRDDIFGWGALPD